MPALTIWNLLSPISLSLFYLSVSCGFLRTTWEETYTILCTDGKNAFATLAMCALLLSLCGLLIGLALLCVNRRCGGHGPIKASDGNTQVAPYEDDYWALSSNFSKGTLRAVVFSFFSVLQAIKSIAVVNSSIFFIIILLFICVFEDDKYT